MQGVKQSPDSSTTGTDTQLAVADPNNTTRRVPETGKSKRKHQPKRNRDDKQNKPPVVKKVSCEQLSHVCRYYDSCV